jgi:SEC-C motif-containing protein
VSHNPPLCYCGNQKPFQHCCQPIHIAKSRAETAEALMRSRFSAFCTQNLSYLVATHQPPLGQKTPTEDEYHSENQWVGLKILNTDLGLKSDNSGHVEFVAFYTLATNDAIEPLHQLRERSFFEQHNHQWFYVSGEAGSRVKISRNETCPCQSGKKTKKCHPHWLC